MAACAKKVEIELPETPTYRVAAAFAGFIFISLAVEMLIHMLHRFLKRRKLVALVHVLGKIKDELMILGFISICLVVLGKPIASICVPVTTAWLNTPRTNQPPPYYPAAYPAKVQVSLLQEAAAAKGAAAGAPAAGPAAAYAAYAGKVTYSSGYKGCPSGTEAMISEYGLKELDVFIFVLALLHIGFCVLACGLAYLKVRQFREWEEEHKEQMAQDLASSDKSRRSVRKTFRLTRSVTMRTAYFSSRTQFLADHGLLRDPPTAAPVGATAAGSSLNGEPPESSDIEGDMVAYPPRATDTKGLMSRRFVGEEPLEKTKELTFMGQCVVACICFFHQFYCSVTKQEYLTVRSMFIESKGLPETYDFFSYLRRITMSQFIKVVGTSWWLWLIAGLLLLFNFDCSRLINWLSLLPLIFAVVIGFKMQRSLALVGLDYLGIDTFRVKRERSTKNAVEAELKINPDGPTLTEDRDHETKRSRWTDPQYVKYLFWLGRPEIILILIHYVLFQCAFQVAYVIWSLGYWGLKTCIFTQPMWVALRVVLSVLAPFMVSFITLPLFALLSTMNPENSRYILPPRLTKGLKAWLASAQRRRHAHGGHDGDDSDDDDHGHGHH